MVAHVETYGKGVLVKGDTRGIKDLLKELGGKWNGKLVGWMYPGSKRDALLKALGSNARVSSVIDKTGGAATAASASSAPAVTATKRAASMSDREDEEALVAPNPATVVAPEVGEEGVVFTISGTFRVTVNSFLGKPGVDIRKFFKDESTKKFLPTAKGIRLNVSEWKALCDKFSEINAFPADESKLEVAGDICAMKKTGIVDIRRFYTDSNDGEKKHTKKGAYMLQEQWSTLQEIAAQVGAALEAPPDANCAPRKKKQRTEKEAPAASTSAGVDGPLSPKQLKTELKQLLKGRDLGAITLKSVRSELEAKLSLAEGELTSRKDEIKTIITWIVQKGGHGSP